ncbi:MAG: sel1 repeat family protein [Puniceicoccales bacterium]|jgi:TPR repeat protein|nr:sel1 repeat family protein [Puniceicoccales bacterium]
MTLRSSGRKGGTGDATAQYTLGRILIEDWGQKENFFYQETNPFPQFTKSQGVKYLSLAAEQKHSAALWELGGLYATGNIVSKDTKRAIELKEKAAENCRDDSYYMALHFDFLDEDDFKAATHLHRAIGKLDGDKSESTSRKRASYQEVLGDLLYKGGKGLQQDYRKAEFWYRQAAEAGSARAQFQLGVIFDFGYGFPQNPSEAFKWFLRAAEQNIPEAQYNVGIMYSEGIGTTKNTVEAVKWYRRAAEENDGDAQWNLGAMYIGGNGVIKNDIEGLAWYYLAKGNGVTDERLERNVINCEAILGRQTSVLAQRRAQEIAAEIKKKQEEKAAAEKAKEEAATKKKSE